MLGVAHSLQHICLELDGFAELLDFQLTLLDGVERRLVEVSRQRGGLHEHIYHEG